MLDTVSKLIESISLAWWALIVPHFWDIAFLALILWCIDLVLRKASATWRYALWCVLLAKILLPFETSSPFSITDNLTRSFDPLSLFVSSPSSESNPGQGEYFAPNLDIQQMHGGSPPLRNRISLPRPPGGYPPKGSACRRSVSRFCSFYGLGESWLYSTHPMLGSSSCRISCG